MAIATPARAGEELLFGPVPEWVEPRPAAVAEGPPTSQPVRAILVDNQVRMEEGKRAIYSAFALQFQTPQGLAAGNVSLPWRPETDELTVHRVVIRRGGETIDVLGSGQTFTTLRREQNLEQATLDGVLTANLIPEDLQVGDILEVATTVVEANPVLGPHDEAILGPMNAPIARAYARLMWPEGEALRLARSPGLPEWKRGKARGFETAEIQLDDVEMIPPPEGAPARFGFLGIVEASDFASWSDLAAHFAPIYAEAARLPADGPLRGEIERIREASADPVVQAEAALKLVQGRVRYVALAMGTGGLLPAEAALTWSRRYGDCKGKTALLLAILGELGIEAEAVFVNTTVGDALPERLPMIGMFDHVLVRARIGGREYWLDGTRTGDTSLARLQVPNFGWGLPVTAAGAELVRMIPAPLAEPSEDLAIRIDASKGVRGPLPATLELLLRGDGALAMKEAVASVVGEAQDRALREYWRERFRDLEPGMVSQTFDEATGEMRLSVEGTWTMDWNGAWYETDETGVGFLADFTREAGYADDAPYLVAYPLFSRTRQTIVLPPGTAGGVDPDAAIDETVAGLEYKRHATLEDGTFLVERTVRSVSPEFAAADAPAAEKRLRELYQKPVHLRMPAGQGPAAGGPPVVTVADAAAALPAAALGVAELLDEGNDFLDSGQFDEALSRFTRATELAPGDAQAWSNRGITLAWQGAYDEAAVDLNRAAALDPRNAVVFRGRGLMAERQGDFPAAIAAYTTAIEIEPGNAFAWGHRAVSRMGDNQPDRALTDAAEALRLSPQYVEMHSLRAFILAGRGRRDEALDEVEAMIAAAPDNPMTLSAASNVYAGLGMNDEARALAERSVSAAPTAMGLFDRARLRDPADAAGRLADLDEALKLAPDFIPALAARAELRAAQGDAEGAFADATAAVESGSAPRQLYALQANLARRLGRKEEARAAAAALVAAEPGSTGAQVEASRIYAALGMYQEAVAAVDNALAIAPEPYLYLDRSAARDPADFDARLADIETALRRAPNYADGAKAKAQVLMDRGDYAGAARAFGQAVALAPTDPVLLTRRGIALAKAGRSREAERDFAQARAILSRTSPEYGAQAFNSICYLKALAGVGLERALAECNESLRLKPDFAPTLDSRGTVLLRMGRLEEAIRDFDRVLEQMPGLVPSRYLRAVARAQQGDADGSRTDAEAARAADAGAVAGLERQGFIAQSAEVPPS